MDSNWCVVSVIDSRDWINVDVKVKCVSKPPNEQMLYKYKLWIVWVPGQDIGGRSGSNTLIQGSEPESHWHGPYNNKLMANLINTVIKLSFPLTEVQISVQKRTANVDSSCK